MANRRLPASEDALELNQIDSNTYITSRYKEGTEQDSDKAIPFKYFQSSPVAICSSTADAVSKIAQVENFPDFALENGREVVVYFENGNIAENPFLNVNNTGSYPIAMETITDATGIKCESGTFYRMTYCDVTSNGVRIRKWIAGASIVDKLDKADVEQTISDSESKIPSSNAVNNALLTKNYEGWGICSAVADAEEKTVTDEVITQLVAGQKIVVKFENANTFGTCVGTDSNVIANGVKLKLNDFPAYPIRVGGENAGEGFVNANDVHTFVFDGTVWNDLTADVIYKGSTTNGNYTKKRNLLIEMWGRSTSTQVPATSTLDIKFPLSFENTDYNISVRTSEIVSTSNNILSEEYGNGYYGAVGTLRVNGFYCRGNKIRWSVKGF